MASFQAKIGWKRQRKRERIKIVVPFRSPPDTKQKIPKKQQNNSKNKKIPLWLHFKPKSDGKCREKENI